MNKREQTTSGKPRARDLGMDFDGEPGGYNAITDVAGIEVGYATLIRGEGALVRGVGPVRTGVTGILPRGRAQATAPVFAASFALNGNGELTGTQWIEESGVCQGPITITNTHSCGLARDATIRWLVERFDDGFDRWILPVAGETFDGTPFEGCDSILIVSFCGIGFELALIVPSLIWLRHKRRVN